MPTSPKPELSRVPNCPHGAIAEAEVMARGLGEVLDFSVNGNPLGQPPGVAAAIRAVSGDRYPENGSPRLRKALAEAVGVEPDRVLVGNGSAELIWLLCAAYLRPGDPVLVVEPTFGEYARAATIHSGVVVEARARAEDGFSLDLETLAPRIEDLAPRLTFICNPNNPTGTYLSRSSVQRVARACRQGLLVVDEAYLSFVSEPLSLLDALDGGVVLLRSMTKDYALAGLRLGYALAAPEVVSAMAAVQIPWSVNAVAQAAGLAALADGEYLNRTREAVAESRAYLTTQLGELGLSVLPSATNFSLVHVGDATALRSALLGKGICVRDCTSFGLPEYIRIGARPLDDCRRLVAAMREVLNDR